MNSDQPPKILSCESSDEIFAAYALELRRSHYEALFQEAPEAYLVTDQSGALLDANRRACELLRLDPAALEGRRLAEFVPLAQLRELYQLRGPVRRELTFTPANGEPRRLCASMSRTSAAHNGNDDRALLRWILSEPHAHHVRWLSNLEQAHSERVLREHRSALSKGALELGKPLSAIMGWTEILHALLEGSGATADDVVTGLRQSAHVLARTLENLLDEVDGAQGQLLLEPSWLSLPEVVDRVVEEQRRHARQREIRLSAVVDRSLPSFEGDAYRLEQVLRNLIESALDRVDGGGTVQVRLSQRSGWAELTVCDASSARLSEPLLSVFDAFIQVQRAQLDDAPDLGLDFARRVVELHGGSLRVARSGEQPRAVSTVRLPLSARPVELYPS